MTRFFDLVGRCILFEKCSGSDTVYDLVFASQEHFYDSSSLCDLFYFPYIPHVGKKCFELLFASCVQKCPEFRLGGKCNIFKELPDIGFSVRLKVAQLRPYKTGFLSLKKGRG